MKYQIGGFASAAVSVGNNNFTYNKNTGKLGRAFGVVTAENTPTEKQFKRAGGFKGIGSVFFLDYDKSANITGSVSDSFLDSCFIAKPLNPQFQYYPLYGEPIIINNFASPITDVDSPSAQVYYSLLNLWNNTQQNSQADNNTPLSLTFNEDPNVRPLLPFDGDYIISARQGSAMRFSTTTKLYNDLNKWSEIGSDNDPIVILTNGLNYNPESDFYVEQINQDKSSIYLTSAQKIPLQTDKTGVLNNLTNPLNVSDYINSQIILNSDRVVLNSKKDEVMIFSKKNIELNTKYIINLNADERVHLNSKSVFLGPYDDLLKYPVQPVLLGYETIFFLSQLHDTLSKLAYYLSNAVSTPEGSPLLGLNIAGKELNRDLLKLCDLLEKLPSKNVFTS